MLGQSIVIAAKKLYILLVYLFINRNITSIEQNSYKFLLRLVNDFAKTNNFCDD